MAQRETMASFKAQVMAELRQGRSVLVAGPAGSGRSHLLKAIAADAEKVLYVAQIGGAKKAVLLELARQLFQADCLTEYAYYADWEDVRKSLNRLPVGELTEAITPALVEYTLAIDELHRATEKAIKEIVIPLAEAGVTLLLAGDNGSRKKRERLNLVANRCLQLDIPRMSAAEARAMLWSLLDKGQYRHWQAIEAKVLNLYDGRPGLVADLAAQLRGTPGSLKDVRQLVHSEMVVFDLTLVTIFFGLGLLMAARFFSRGLEDPTLYIIAGSAYAATLVLRPLLWSWRR